MIVTIDSSATAILDWSAKGKDRIIQNVRNILNTRKYEVAYDRDLGITPDIIDADIYTIRSIIKEDLRKNLEMYEPRASLLSVEVKPTDNGGVAVVVEIEV